MTLRETKKNLKWRKKFSKIKLFKTLKEKSSSKKKSWLSKHNWKSFLQINQKEFHQFLIKKWKMKKHLKRQSFYQKKKKKKHGRQLILENKWKSTIEMPRRHQLEQKLQQGKTCMIEEDPHSQQWFAIKKTFLTLIQKILQIMQKKYNQIHIL